MPLTDKGQKILASMQRQYGDKKGKSVFYASINAGKITGAEGRARGGRVPYSRDYYPLMQSSYDLLRERDMNVSDLPAFVEDLRAADPEYRTRRYQAGGEVAGLVDHDRDPELPRTPEAARLIPMLPLPSGYRDPAYISVIQRLIEGQRRLNAMNPVVRENLRRYWAGGLIRHFRLGGRV
jgi:hypothetical protein